MKKFILVLMLLGVLGTAGIAAAFGAFTIDQRAAIKQAIENNSYEDWREAMIATLTQENFNKIVERYKIMTERRELVNAIKQAIKEGNYTAYKEAAERLIKTFRVMNEEEFNAFVEHCKETQWRFRYWNGCWGWHYKKCRIFWW
ncbi:MAG: hypothetical protein QXJ68_03800 [Methanocellales archaeon]